jgi:predicted alpha/beta hydrolase
MWGLGQHTLLGIVVGLRGASGNTLYWALLLVYVEPRQHTLLGIVLVYVGPLATHFTGYCCWFMWGLGQHILLGIAVGLFGASGNILHWVLLLAYVGPLVTHFTRYYCWVMLGFGQHILLCIIVGLMWAFSSGFKNI